MATENPMKDLLVIVLGIMGTVLSRNGRETFWLVFFCSYGFLNPPSECGAA